MQASRRPAFEWCVTGENARRFLRDILPWLDEKLEQAQIVLTLSGIPPAERAPLKARLAALKRINYRDDSADRR